MRIFFRCSIFFFLFSCVDHNYVDNRFESVLREASLRCGSGHDMQWLRPVLEKTESDPAFQGKLYAVTQNGQTIFIHQPDIFNCMACLLYDCDGNRVNNASADIPYLTQNMNAANLLYTAPKK